MQAKKVFFIFILLLFLILAKPLFFFADEVDYPDLPNVPAPTPEQGLPSYVNYIFNIALALGGLVAFGVLIWGGVLYLTSAGNPEQIGSAKKKLTSALSGLLILFAIYLILTTINPDLVSLQLPEIIGTPPSGPLTPTEPQKLELVFKEIPLGTIAESILAKNISCFDKDRNLIDCQQSECIIDNQHAGQYICQKGQVLQGAVENIFSSETDFRYCYQYDENGNKEKLLENNDQYQCLQNLIDAIEIKTQKLIDLSNELNSLLKNGCKCSNCSTGWCTTKKSEGCSYCDSHCSCCGGPRGDKSCNPNEGIFKSGYDPCSNRKEIDIKREEIKILIENGDPTDYSNDNYEKEVYNTAKENLGVNEKFLSLNEAKRRIEGIKNDLENGLNDLKKAENLMKTPFGKRLTLAEYFVLKQQSQIPVQKEEFGNYKIEKYCFYFNCNSTTNKDLCNSCGLSNQKRMCRIETANNISVEDYVFLGDPATFYLIKQCKEYADENSCKRANCNWSEDGCWGDTGQEYLEETLQGKSSLNIEEEKGFIKSLIPIGETVDETEVFVSKILSPVQIIGENLQNVINAGNDLYGFPEQCECSSRCTNSSKCKSCGCCRRCDCDEPPCGCCASDYCCSGCTTCAPRQGGSDYYVCPINDIEARIKDISKKTSDKDNYIEASSINEQKKESKATFTINLDPNCESYAIQLLDPCDSSLWMRFYKTAVLERDGENLNYQIPAPEGSYSDYPTYWEVNRETIGWGKYSSCQDPATFYLDLLGEIKWSGSSKLIITLETNYKVDSNYSFQATIKKSCSGYLQSIKTAKQRLSNLTEAKNLTKSDPNRCTLLDKLSLSRDRLEKCITGYGFAFKESSKKRIFSSKIGLDLVYLGKWIILPDFPYPPLKGELNAYPYNSSMLTDEQKEICRNNKDSLKCSDYIKDLLENYYCLYE